MAGVTNIVGISYTELATNFLNNLQAAMDRIIGGEITTLQPILTAMLIMFVGRQFFLLLTGNMTVQRFIDSIAKALLIIFLIGHAPNYAQRIETPVFQNIPQALSAMVLSTDADLNVDSSQSVATQFDKVSAGSAALMATVQAKYNGWSLHDFEVGAGAFVLNFGIQIGLCVMLTMWLIGQGLLAIILCFGPPMLLFELFDRTRGWVNQWIGKIIGSICFGFGTSILLSIEMQFLMSMLQNAYDSGMANGTEAVSMMMQIFGAAFIQALMMLSLPTICGYGSGVAASVAAPAAFALASTVSGGRSLGALTVQSIRAVPDAASNDRGRNSVSGGRSEPS